MTLKSFMNLYLRNARDALYLVREWPLTPKFDVLGFITIMTTLSLLAYILLLPVTLTIGAFFKTVIDVFTRKPMNETELDSKKAAIDQMGLQEINTLANNIALRSPVSYSGRALKAQLKEFSVQASREIVKGYNEKKYNLALDQLGPEADRKFKADFVVNLALDEKHAEQLDAYDLQNQRQLQDARIKNQKEQIKQYLSDETNNGTKVMQTIFGLFPKAASKIIQKKDTNTDINLQALNPN